MRPPIAMAGLLTIQADTFEESDMTDHRFTTDELTKLPKWAMIKVLGLQQSESDLRQERRGHCDQVVLDAARAFRDTVRHRIVNTGPYSAERQETDEQTAEKALVGAVDAWEDWAAAQKEAGRQ